MKIHFQNNTELFNEMAVEKVIEIGCASLITLGPGGPYIEWSRITNRFNK